MAFDFFRIVYRSLFIHFHWKGLKKRFLLNMRKTSILYFKTDTKLIGFSIKNETAFLSETESFRVSYQLMRKWAALFQKVQMESISRSQKKLWNIFGK